MKAAPRMRAESVPNDLVAALVVSNRDVEQPGRPGEIQD
jgi:hypothetical protein